MPSVDISAQHSKDERPYFGLDRILDDLLKDPLKEHVICARVVRSGLTVNDQKGTSTPRIRPLHIEVVLDETRIKLVLDVLDQEYRDRTGRHDLPPSDLFNSDRDAGQSLGAALDGQTTIDGQTTVDEQIADRPDNVRPLFSDPRDHVDDPQGPAAADPTAGPHPGEDDSEHEGSGLWPGDAGYAAPR